MGAQPWYILPPSHFPAQEAVIIGGGLAGCFSAYSLAKRGWRVTLIERYSTVGQGASSNKAGLLMPLLAPRADLIGQWFLQGYHYSWERIREFTQSRAALAFDACGVLDLAPSHAMRTPENLLSGLEVTAVSIEETSRISGIELHHPGVFFDGAGWVNVGQFCRAAIDAYPLNINLLYHHEAISLKRDGELWHVLDNTGQAIAAAPVVVIANAADALAFEPCQWLPLESIRGQLTLLSESHLKLRTILSYGGYMTPAIEGFHTIGATFDRHAEPVPTRESHQQNLNVLHEYIELPSLNFDELQGRVAFRAATPDRRACVGPLPDAAAFAEEYGDLHHGRPPERYAAGRYHPGLYVSVGHGSRGLTSAPLAGEYLAALIHGESLPIAAELTDLLNPARFLIRDLRRGILRQTKRR